MVTIQCAIFDFGGVITKPQPEQYVDRMSRLLGVEKDGFVREYRENRHDYDRGTVDGRGYWRRIASAFDREIGDETIDALIEYDVKSWTIINQDMKKYIRTLHRNGLKTAILSNINFDTIRHLEAHQKWIARLDHRIFSCELNMIKPEKAIYERCLSEVGCAPEECLFVDDLDANVQAANALGIHAILFENSREMMGEIGLNYRFEA
ncbi:MAG: HAD family phosphatase [Rectinema sp.]